MAKRDILQHLLSHVGEWLHNQDLRAVSKIDDVPRAIRSLRQQGWDIESRRDGCNRLHSIVKGTPGGTREGISLKLRYLVLNRDGHRCRGCGRGVDDGIKLVVDHIVPVDWGGNSQLENLQALCEECNQGKQAWVADLASDQLSHVMSHKTVEQRIEALFDAMPDRDVPSLLIQLVSGNAFDWQRALRRVRERTGKKIVSVQQRAYRFHPD